MYVGLSRQETLQRELDVVANNVANVDTAGFKVESLIVQTDPQKLASAGDGPGVVNFTSLSALSKDGDGLYRNVSNLQPQAAPNAKIRQGMVESSNVEPITQITRLIAVSRAYESISQMMSNTADLTDKTIDRLGRVS